MKTSLTLLCAFLLSGAGASVEETLAYDPEEGVVLERTFEAFAEYELVEVAYGEEAHEVPSEFAYGYESLERIVVTDEILEVEDGRPLELVRTFDELSQESTFRTSENDGGEEFERTLVSDLEGVTVRFLWDEDAEAYFAEPADQDDLDDDVLDWLLEDMDLRLVLPDEEVEVGDTWEIDPAAYLSVMWPGGLLDFYDEDEEEGVDTREIDEGSIENLEGEGEATLDEIREEDGVQLAVISISLEIETQSFMEFEDAEGRETYQAYASSRDIGGIVYWDLERGTAQLGRARGGRRARDRLADLRSDRGGRVRGRGGSPKLDSRGRSSTRWRSSATTSGPAGRARPHPPRVRRVRPRPLPS